MNACSPPCSNYRLETAKSVASPAAPADGATARARQFVQGPCPCCIVAGRQSGQELLSVQRIHVRLHAQLECTPALCSCGAALRFAADAAILGSRSTRSIRDSLHVHSPGVFSNFQAIHPTTKEGMRICGALDNNPRQQACLITPDRPSADDRKHLLRGGSPRSSLWCGPGASPGLCGAIMRRPNSAQGRCT